MRKTQVALLILSIVPLFSFHSAQALQFPVRFPQGLGPVNFSQCVPVKSANVLIADYDLIRKDFPEVSSFSGESINRWILEQMGYISLVRSEEMIGDDPVDSKMAFQPFFQQDSLVFNVLWESHFIGLVDSKGANSNNLITTASAFREYIKEKLIRLALQHSQQGYSTVESYAVIDLGFKVNHSARINTGILLRQAHRKRLENSIYLNSERSLEIERILRRYGITSVDELKTLKIQGASGEKESEIAILNFDTYCFQSNFKDSLIEFVPSRDRISTVLLSRDMEDYVQPEFSYHSTSESLRIIEGLLLKSPAELRHQKLEKALERLIALMGIKRPAERVDFATTTVISRPNVSLPLLLFQYRGGFRFFFLRFFNSLSN